MKESPLKALILAAGYGTRLKNLTKDKPKAIVEFAGIPMIYFALHALKKAGVKDLIINLHYKGDDIKNLLGNGSNLGLNIDYSSEKEILGTGGAIKNVESFFQGESSFFVINSDIISSLNLKTMVDYHNQNKSFITLATKENVKSDLYFSQDGLIKSISSPSENCSSGVFTGVHLLSKNIFKYLELKFSSIIDAYQQCLKEDLPLYAWEIGQDFWFDFGIKEEINDLENLLKKQYQVYLKEVKSDFGL